MLKHLISLVLLFTLVSYKASYSDTNIIILPEPKPKILLNITKEKKYNIIPKKKTFFYK